MFLELLLRYFFKNLTDIKEKFENLHVDIFSSR